MRITKCHLFRANHRQPQFPTLAFIAPVNKPPYLSLILLRKNMVKHQWVVSPFEKDKGCWTEKKQKKLRLYSMGYTKAEMLQYLKKNISYQM